MDKELEAILMTMLEEQRRQGAVLEEVRNMAVKTAMKVEGVIEPKLQVLADGVLQNTERLDRVDQRLDRMDQRLDRLERRVDTIAVAVGAHDMDIRELKAIK